MIFGSREAWIGIFFDLKTTWSEVNCKLATPLVVGEWRTSYMSGVQSCLFFQLHIIIFLLETSVPEGLFRIKKFMKWLPQLATANGSFFTFGPGSPWIWEVLGPGHVVKKSKVTVSHWVWGAGIFQVLVLSSIFYHLTQGSETGATAVLRSSHIRRKWMMPWAKCVVCMDW